VGRKELLPRGAKLQEFTITAPFYHSAGWRAGRAAARIFFNQTLTRST
jgi:hypothetical protein